MAARDGRCQQQRWWIHIRWAKATPSIGGGHVGASSDRAFQLEREVAAIYRALGARVEQNVVVAGNQIDVVVEEETASGSRIKTVIECKNFSRPVGVEVVNQFAPLFGLFKNRGLADKGTIVASEGFTKQARAAANDMGVELLEFADLQHRVQGRASDLKAAEEEVDQARIAQAVTGKKQPPRIFVVMPFADEFVDVYVLGIEMLQRSWVSLCSVPTIWNITATFSRSYTGKSGNAMSSSPT